MIFVTSNKMFQENCGQSSIYNTVASQFCLVKRSQRPFVGTGARFRVSIVFLGKTEIEMVNTKLETEMINMEV